MIKKYTFEERPLTNLVACYDCGMSYKKFPDMVISNDLWNKISPRYEPGCGILCPTCICKRLELIKDQVDQKFEFQTYYNGE